jgi:hypothetical protein
MKHLFKDWECIQAQIQRAENLFLLLDYDGTLTPIVSQPELALCPSEVKRHLEKLRDLPGVYLAIISGRSLEDVRRKVGVSGITYVGNHGLEIENPVGRHKKLLAPDRKRELKRIIQNLQNSLKEIPGILFEEKGPILSVHYRNVPQKFFTQVPQVVEAGLRRASSSAASRAAEILLAICVTSLVRGSKTPPEGRRRNSLFFSVRMCFIHSAILAIGPAILQRIKRRVVREITRAFTKKRMKLFLQITESRSLI